MCVLIFHLQKRKKEKKDVDFLQERDNCVTISNNEKCISGFVDLFKNLLKTSQLLNFKSSLIVTLTYSLIGKSFLCIVTI